MLGTDKETSGRSHWPFQRRQVEAIDHSRVPWEKVAGLCVVPPEPVSQKQSLTCYSLPLLSCNSPGLLSYSPVLLVLESSLAGVEICVYH